MYQIVQNECKFHYATQEDIAKSVAKDLQERFSGEATVTEIFDGNEYMWDMGGSVLQAWKPALIEHNGFKLYFWPHQLSEVNYYLKVAIDDIRDREGTPYIKIHGRWNCLCLSEIDARAISSKLAAEYHSLKELSNQALEMWENALDSMRQNPHPNVLIPAKEKKMVN
jgi:hypothetical protein